MKPKVNRISLIWIHWLCLMIGVCFTINSYAQLTTKEVFIENKGQWPKEVLFKAELSPSITLFIESNGYTVSLIEPIGHGQHEEDAHHQHPNETILGHACKIKFVNSKVPVIRSVGKSVSYSNYFTKPGKSTASRVFAYGEVWLKELYPGIDVRFMLDGQAIKYEFHLKPDANPNSIILEYEGQEGLKLNEGNLVVQTSIEDFGEKAPESWCFVAGEKVPITTEFSLARNRISFYIKGMPADFDELVIDPELIFSTYSGSLSDNWGFTATYDKHGNVYSGGIVGGNYYPVSPGAFQLTRAGGWDVGIIKYSPDGLSRLFATYLGGINGDMPHSLIVNDNNELIIFGTTGSPDFPVSPNAFDTSFNGGQAFNYESVLNFPDGSDMFISVLSEEGDSLMASTFIGGSGNDGVNYRTRYASVIMNGNDTLYYNYGDGVRGEVITDSQNNIYVGSCTFSNDFPITSNAFQLFNNGKQEGLICKFDPSLSQLVWSSYLGGSHDDAIYSIDSDQNGDVYVTGGTVSSNFPVTPSAAYATFNGGSADGFISHVKSDGSILLGSTYFGSVAYDQGYFIRTDKDDAAYIFGQTRATGSTLMQNTIYGTPNSGQFLAKFPYALDTVLWSTVFGTGNGQPNISPTSFMVDKCKRLYVSGWGRIWGNSVYQGVYYPWGSVFGTKNMQITPDAIQSVTDGQDFYVAVFAENATGLDYGTYFGEVHYGSCSNSGRDHVDGGTSRFDPQGAIVQSVCASCGACQQFPTFPNPGVWSVTNQSSNCNNAVFKIQLKTDIASSAFNVLDFGCAPDTVYFQNLGAGSSFLWTFGDPGSGAADTSLIEDPTHVYTQAGIYNVRLISYLPGGCIAVDTAYKTIVVQDNTSSILDTVFTCSGIPVQIGLSGNSGNSTYTWTPSTGLSNPNIPNPFANPLASTNYNCIVDNGSCIDTLLQTVEVNSLQVSAGSDGLLCAGNQLITGSSNRSGVSFIWSSSALFYDTINNYPYDSTIVIQLVADTNLFLKGISSKGCQDTDDVTLINGSPAIDAGMNDTICLGETVTLTVQNLTSTIPVTYSWMPEAYILNGAQTSQALAQPPTSMWFYVQAISPAFCSAIDSVFVVVDSLYVVLSQMDVSCNGFCDGSASLSVVGGIGTSTISWSNGAVGLAITGLCAGNYWVQVVDSAGCDTLVNFTILEPQAISVASEVTNVLCNGSYSGAINLTVSGGTPPYSYLWSNGATSQDIGGLVAGTYSVVITDANLCQVSLEYEITEPLPFDISLEKVNVSCKNGNNGQAILSVEGATPPYTIQWSNGDIGVMADSLLAGTVSANIMDNNNCDTLIILEITEPDSLLVSSVVENVTCFGGNDGSVLVVPIGGTAPYSFLWSNGAATAGIEELTAGLYEVVVSDSLGCQSVKNILVSQALPIEINSVINPVTCKGSADGAILCTVTGGTSPYAYLWNNGSTTSNLFMQTGGNYQLMLTDANQCDTTLQFVIPESIDSLEIHSVVKDPTCFGLADGSIQLEVMGGAMPYQYLWWNGAVTSGIHNLGSGTFLVTVTDSHACSRHLEFELAEPDSVQITSLISPANCGNDGLISVDVQGGTSPYTYLWSNGELSPTISNLSPGHYSLNVVDSNDCTSSLTIHLTGVAPIQSLAQVQSCLCYGSNDGQVVLSIEGGTMPYLITWQPGSLHGNPVTGLQADTYVYTIIDGIGCVFADSVFVPQPDSLTITHTVNPAICEGRQNGSIYIEVDGGTSPYAYLWNNQAITQNLENIGRGFYSVQVSDINQCVVFDTITVQEVSCELIIPNIYTPNGDGVNDNFVIVGIEFYPDNQLLIFNRWGKEILQFTSYKNEWDGRDALGDKVADGVYFYILRLNDGRQFQGSITIMRE